MNEAGFNSDIIESSLAHTDKNEVRRAYNRANYLKQRNDLLAWWGEKIQNASITKYKSKG